MPRFYVLSGPDVGKSFDVEAGATFGREPECAVRLRDPSVSRHHARLEGEGGRWMLVDIGSRNGILARGHRMECAPLEDGEEIRLGEVLLRFRTAAVGEATPEPVRPLAGVVKEPVGEEIALEGDWDAAAAARAPRAEPVEAPRAPVRAPESPALARTTLTSPRPVAPGQTASRDRGVLQFHRIPDRPGFFAADVGQQPLWVRFGVWILGLAVFAALFLVAFKGASFLKGKVSRSEAAVEDEGAR